VDSLISRFRIRCRKFVVAGIYISINKIFIKCFGRIKYTLQIDSKAARKGYKLYVMTLQGGYLVDFRFTSKVSKIAEIYLKKRERFILLIIIEIIESLSKRTNEDNFYII
jgi:hypothetical protein